MQKEPLRRLRPEERSHLERVSRAFGLPAALVARAKVLLAVADGHTYIEAAHLAEFATLWGVAQRWYDWWRIRSDDRPGCARSSRLYRRRERGCLLRRMPSTSTAAATVRT